VVALTTAVGCDEDDGGDDGLPACVDFDTMACTPQYPPEFDRVFTETLQPTCGVAGSACHGEPDADGTPGGMLVTDADGTYATLLGEGGGTQFVVVGDPLCSLMMVRLNVDDPALVMPPGQQPIDEDVRCSIATWIAEGAQR
jgi:hypothetical protein